MGGSSKSSQSSAQTTTNNDQDVMVEGGGIGVGSGGAYVSQGLQENAIGLQLTESNIADFLGNGAVKIGENNVVNLTAMDGNTQSVLDQALTIVSANANNMMTLAAGRDANKPLADDSAGIAATGKAVSASLDSAAELFSPGRIAAGVAVAGVLYIMVKKPKKGKK